MVLVCYLSLSLGVVSAQHFNYDEAVQIASGQWYNTSNGKTSNFIWQAGGECNIVNGKGYTDPNGESLIFFDDKGTPAYLRVTYYPDQDKYYAAIAVYDRNRVAWCVINNSLSK